MKKGYDVILYLTYRETIKIETDEKDEEKIMDMAAINFVDSMRGTGDVDDIMGEIEAVKIERNYSEEAEFQRWREEDKKNYLVTFTPTCCDLEIKIAASDEKEAEEVAEENIETEFISKDGKTECVVVEYELKDIGVME